MRARARGTGNVYQPSYKDRATGEKRLSPYFHIRYRVNGRQKRERTECTNQRAAESILRKRLEDVEAGRPTGPAIERTTLADVLGRRDEHGQVVGGLLVDYFTNKRKSLPRVEDSIQHLKAFLGEHARARSIDEQRIAEYVAHRLTEGAANGTINRELTALKRGFRLAARSGRVARVPYIAMLKEAAPRSGFVEREQLDAILAGLPEILRAVVMAAYLTGWRVASEILTREWRHVDFDAGWLRLEPGETKNGDGRMFPLTAELRAVLEAQRAYTEDVGRATGRVVALVFHRRGKRVASFRRAWQAACAAAGLPHLIPHDLRRTAVRNLERAGVPRSTAMKLVGHVTESVYRRYAITDEAMLKEGAAKLSAFHESTRTIAARKVVSIQAGKARGGRS
jgi:integrase